MKACGGITKSSDFFVRWVHIPELGCFWQIEKRICFLSNANLSDLITVLLNAIMKLELLLIKRF